MSDISAKTIDLGETETVKALFSWPPNCHEICFLPQSLEETVQHYVNSSLQRDQYTDSTVRVQQHSGHTIVEISGGGAPRYVDLLPQLIQAGTHAFASSQKLNVEKLWNYNWRFFLPLGLSMAQHRTVQLLHFPPDYVLSRDQDYLSAHTTLRWADLLQVNGIAATDTCLYQNIVDIAPIAAPSNDGKNLEGVYGYFDEYILSLLEAWLPRTDGGQRPMVAFGGPVRAWLKSKFSVDLQVLSFATIPVSGSLAVNTLAANHPSFIYNALTRLEKGSQPTDKQMLLLMRIMQQDLIAANWQADMGKNPSLDPVETLEACKARWMDPEKQTQICELTYEQVFNKRPEEAAKLCVKLPKPVTFLEKTMAPELDAELDRIRNSLGPLDGREPQDIH